MNAALLLKSLLPPPKKKKQTPKQITKTPIWPGAQHPPVAVTTPPLLNLEYLSVQHQISSTYLSSQIPVKHSLP